jgi:hypothetical protein
MSSGSSQLMESGSFRHLKGSAFAWPWSIPMPVLICLWPRLADHLILHLNGLVWVRGLPSSLLASSEALMSPEASRIFHTWVVHAEVFGRKPAYVVDGHHVLRGHWMKDRKGPHQCHRVCRPPLRMCRLPFGWLDACSDEGRQSLLERASEDLHGARLGGGRKLSLYALLRSLPAANIRQEGLSRTWSGRLLQEALDLPWAYSWKLIARSLPSTTPNTYILIIGG